MTRADIIEKLIEKGYQAEERDSVKNGVLFQGVLVKPEKAYDPEPIIYTDALIERAERDGQDIEKVVTIFLHTYEECKDALDYDIDNLSNRDWIYEHLSIALQRKSNQTELIKRDVEELPGIEAYLYIKTTGESGDNYEVKLNERHMNLLGMREDMVWEKALENDAQETEIVNMEQILQELLNITPEEEGESMLYVLTNKDRVKGASAILNRKLLKEFAKKKGVDKLFILPSSVHEMILIPWNEEFRLEDLTVMVKEVNAGEVNPVDQLADQAYILNL